MEGEKGTTRARQSMEYERIDKVQLGILSPSKLRVNLFGSPQRGKVEGKRSFSSSPIKSKDAACALLDEDQEFGDEVDLKSSEEILDTTANLGLGGTNSGNKQSVVVRDGGLSDSRCTDSLVFQRPLKENTSTHARMQSVPPSIVPSFSKNMVYPIKSTEENVDCGIERGNAAACGFEFHNQGESSISMAFSRHLPSKWNDAEKWVVSKQPVRTNHSRRIGASIHANRAAGNHATRIMTEGIDQQGLSVLQVANIKTEIGDLSEKFRFDGFVANQAPGRKISVNVEKLSTYPTEISKHSGPLDSTNVQRHSLAVKSVSMRDMGTEMTPIASEEPSRTGTPAIATTPVISPDLSLPSTPRNDVTAMPSSESFGNKKEQQSSTGKTELSERELRLKTRREIKDLSIQLGKISIAAWASQDKDDEVFGATTMTANPADLQKVEFELRAAEWAESMKAKHDARYQRQVVKIQAWENHVKAKAEAKMRRMQVKVEHITASTRERLLNRLTAARLQAEAKRKAAVAKRDQWSIKTSQQAAQICETGHIPWSCFSCYSGN